MFSVAMGDGEGHTDNDYLDLLFWLARLLYDHLSAVNYNISISLQWQSSTVSL